MSQNNENSTLENPINKELKEWAKLMEEVDKDHEEIEKENKND